MAYKTGTAASHTALWNTLIDFLTNEPALVAAGQAWSIAWQHATGPELVLVGPGLAGTDEIYVGLKRVDERFATGESEIVITGCTGIINSATEYHEHVNDLGRRPRIMLDFSPMQYWMVANGRRFVVVVKVSTTYQAMYGGFFLPFGTPSAYPYPLFIGGTAGSYTNTNEYVVRSWRDGERDGYRHFVYPWASAPNATYPYDSTAFMLDPQVTWRGGTFNYARDSVYQLPGFLVGPRGFPHYLGGFKCSPTQGRTYYGSGSNDSQRLGYDDLRALLIPGLNGELPLMPITLMSANFSESPNPVTYGVLDGCFSVAGDSNYAENIITAYGVDHLVVPNVMRSSVYEYWALALE